MMNRQDRSGAYNRVSSSEQSFASAPSSINTNKRVRTRKERISDKFHALLWVAAAYATIRHTDFFNVIVNDENVFRPCLLLGVVGLMVNTVLVLYLAIYIPKIAKMDRYPWDVYWCVMRIFLRCKCSSIF